MYTFRKRHGLREEGYNFDAMEEKSVNLEEEKRVEYDDNGDDFDQEDESDEDFVSYGFMPSPSVPLKDHLEKDKDDDSLRKWKQKLLGDVEEEIIGQIEPEVTFHSIGIVSDGNEEIVIPLPIKESENRVLFTLKEGAMYCLKLKFSVQHNIVSGLTYKNTVWKGYRKVDQTKGMLGSFAPSQNPYEETLEAEATPSGIFARGICSAKLEFKDDDNHSYLELNYSFEIRKH